VPHVELSVSSSNAARPRSWADTSLARWAGAVAEAEEPSLVIDFDEFVVAISAPFMTLLGLTTSPIGQPMVGEVLQLLDFADGADLNPAEVVKAPPLLALTSSRLARGLMRVRCAAGACTLDAIASPLLVGGEVAGSLTFFSPV
jgi:hypothetical protein